MKRFIAGLLLFSSTAWASVDLDTLKDPALEQRARTIARGLRCLVCQNESIEDSDAPLAHDLRDILRERLAAGDTDDQARAYIVARYGEWVLLKPPFNRRTVALWIAPGIALLGGGFAIVMARSRRKAALSDLSPDEQARVAKLLDDVNV